MKINRYYSIGQASKICDVSPRMLRYYEEIGLIRPDKISEETRYRYYTISTMRDVQAIRYLVDQGFSLEEIRQALIHDDLDAFQEFFLKKIEETQHKIEYYHQRLDSLKGWCGLIIEGKEALRHRAFSPHITYLPKRLYFYYERERSPEEKNSEIYIETEYFTKSKKDGHSMVDVGGAFTLYYPSWRERMENTYTRQTLLQISTKTAAVWKIPLNSAVLTRYALIILEIPTRSAIPMRNWSSGVNATVSLSAETASSGRFWIFIPRGIGACL